MATPYFQLRRLEVPSTQDVARDNLRELPAVVIAASQTSGRGRQGTGWENADRSLAISVAFRASPSDIRPFSLMAGVAAVRSSVGATSLKWPNDVMDPTGLEKVGGILTERSDDVVTVGLGMNLFWPEAPEGAAALLDEDPGIELHRRLGGEWAAEMMRLVDASGWPVDEYRRMCSTMGRLITWEPDGFGEAVNVTDEGSLVVRQEGELFTITSGAVRHVRG